MQGWEEKAMEREAGKEQMSKLDLLLLKEKRYEELEKASIDPEYCKILMKKYGLEK
ncbi:MAG: hypothetical protein MR380_05685 [Lachnospiraceae bacterium]|nr:hypothetical protein [Lachnospiraceae bacterium]